MSELRELRARVLFADGRRPEFGRGGARQGDVDELDIYSAHVVTRCRGSIVGCVRLTPIVGPLRSVTEQTIGYARLQVLLADVHADAAKVVEHSRWIVDPMHKSIGTGVYLMSASFALAYKLGFPSSVATVSHDVVPILERAGARRAPGLPLLRSDAFRDEVAVLYGHQREFSRTTLAQFQRAAIWLGLGQVYENP